MTPASSFLNLPHEVRVLIYHHLFIDASVALGSNTSAPLVLAPILSILLSCRLCHDEANSIFYKLTTFHLKFPRQSEIEYPGPSLLKAQKRFGENARHVGHVCYYGKVPKLVDRLRDVLPNLKVFEMSLFYDFFHSDQTNFERAMRYALRYGEWKHAIQDALDHRFPTGMRDAVAVLRHMGPDRGFQVKLHWRMGYRFVEFVSLSRCRCRHASDTSSKERSTLMSGSCASEILTAIRARCMIYLKTRSSLHGPISASHCHQVVPIRHDCHALNVLSTLATNACDVIATSSHDFLANAAFAALLHNFDVLPFFIPPTPEILFVPSTVSG